MPRWATNLVNAFPDHPKPELDLSALTLDDTPAPYPPFPFFSLPPELRNRVYCLVLLSKPDYRGANGKRKGSRLSVLLASHRFHNEASYILYTSYNFRLFPLQDFTPLPTIQEIPIHYRGLVANLEMTVGSSWTAPPKSWRVSKGLARVLSKLKSIQTLRVFVQLDPSHPAFAKYRISLEFYTNFCGNLIKEVMSAMPQLKFVELDGNPGIEVNGPLVSRLRLEAEGQGKAIKYGKQSEWAHKV